MEFDEKLGFLMVENFLGQDVVEDLSSKIFQKSNYGISIGDAQCPNSPSFDCTVIPEMREIHDVILPHAEKVFGKELFVTYSYCRKYLKGEILDKHTDRESCEYSITATLMSSDETTQWPIFMESNNNGVKSEYRCGMNPGDVVFYKGRDVAHWREECEKDWHMQIFFHFVDKNGKLAGHKEDQIVKNDGAIKEECTDGYKEVPRQDFDCWVYNNEQDSVPSDICDYYVRKYTNKPYIDNFESAQIGGSDVGGEVNTDVRNVKNLDLIKHGGPVSFILAAALDANNQCWQFELEDCSQSEYLWYKAGGKYQTHYDEFWNRDEKQQSIRKLSGILLLNDDFEGGKFYVQGQFGKFYPEQKKGTIIIFPSFMPHGCEPVTKGERHTIVGWFNGKRFK